MNFNPDLVHEVDVRDFDFSKYSSVDLVAGGPPCQPFSLGGLARAHNDCRDMFPQAVRAIRELQPKAFIFENVKGLLRKSFSTYFNYIVSRLSFPSFLQIDGETWQSHAGRLQALSYPEVTGLKYRVQVKLLNAVDYAVPQIRERVFFVGLRSDVLSEWTWPTPTIKPSERVTVGDIIKKLPVPTANHHLHDHVFIGGARIYPGHTGSNINKPSKTIKAGAHGVPGGENMICFEDGSVRYMTVREAKLIQTFPAGYKISGAWGEALRQIGNAVPVKLAEILGQQLIKTLQGAERQYGVPIYRTGTDGAYMLFERNMPYLGQCRSGSRVKKHIVHRRAAREVER